MTNMQLRSSRIEMFDAFSSASQQQTTKPQGPHANQGELPVRAIGEPGATPSRAEAWEGRGGAHGIAAGGDLSEEKDMSAASAPREPRSTMSRRL
ncbi:hypothetical protein [Saccharopolyspora shandongensis]|uniref:hypothetical protein n=1 Tax=Saccharopolyspora shandongensis TaxID=418495 RepID=UPI00340D469D